MSGMFKEHEIVCCTAKINMQIVTYNTHLYTDALCNAEIIAKSECKLFKSYSFFAIRMKWPKVSARCLVDELLRISCTVQKLTWKNQFTLTIKWTKPNQKVYKMTHLYKLHIAYTIIEFSDLRYMGTLPTHKGEVKMK
jgi:hypothetical protein